MNARRQQFLNFARQGRQGAATGFVSRRKDLQDGHDAMLAHMAHRHGLSPIGEADAERRLRQMYHHCEIIHCHSEAVNLRNDPLDLEAVIGIISDEPATVPSVARSMLRNKSGTH